jgi:hypothetical protein
MTDKPQGAAPGSGPVPESPPPAKTKTAGVFDNPEFKAYIEQTLDAKMADFQERLLAALTPPEPEPGEEPAGDEEAPQKALTPFDEGFWEQGLNQVTEVQCYDLIFAADRRAYRIHHANPYRATCETGYIVPTTMVPKPWLLVWRKRAEVTHVPEEHSAEEES